LDHKSGELVGENFMVDQFLEKLVKTKARLAPWMEEGVRNFLAQIGSHGVLWIVSTSNVSLLSNGDNQGGYGVVQKVQIKRFDYIPNTIKLTRKTLKTDDNQKTHNQQSVETLALFCECPSVIKFLAIHTKTMEAYTLWWIGRTFQ